MAQNKNNSLVLLQTFAEDIMDKKVVTSKKMVNWPLSCMLGNFALFNCLPICFELTILLEEIFHICNHSVRGEGVKT